MILTVLQKLALNLALQLIAFVGEHARELVRSFVEHVKAERADDPTLAAVITKAVAEANARRAKDSSISWVVLLEDVSDDVMEWAKTAGREYSRALVNAMLEAEVLAQRDPLPPDSARVPGSGAGGR